MNLPGYDNVVLMHRGEAAFTARRIADNGIYPPSTKDAIQAGELAEAAPFWTDENAPHVNTQPPQLRAYRQKLRVRAVWDLLAAPFFAAVLGSMVSVAVIRGLASRFRGLSRDDKLMAVAAFVMLSVLIGFAMTPDTAVVQAQMEASQ